MKLRKIAIESITAFVMELNCINVFSINVLPRFMYIYFLIVFLVHQFLLACLFRWKNCNDSK